MSDTKTVYLIKVYDPRPTEYSFEGREYFDYSKGAFTSKEVAEEVLNGMRLFQEKDDPTTYRVVPFKLNEESSFEEWMDNNAPWRKGRKAG